MAELRYTYLLDVKDRASRAVTTANERIARSAQQANRAMEKQGAVAQSASRQIQSAGARQAAEWKQVARAAQTAERTVAQAATQASTKVSRALDRQIAAQRKAGASYAQIAREQRAAGASAAQTAAAIERSAAREQKAMAGRQRAAKGLSGIASSFKGFAGIALAAGGVSVLTKALSDSVAEGTEAVKAHAQTVAALKSTGGAANVTAKQIESLSTAISNQVGIDDEAIQSAENLLLTFTRVRNETGKGNDVFNRATRTIVDMSVALKTPLKNASILVGKALQDPIRGLTSLRRVGVSFTDQQRKQIATMVQSGRSMEAQKLILRELNREFGGSARAAATPMQKLGVVIKNLEETMGRALLPVINRAATALSKFFVQMQTGRGAGGQFAKTVSQIWTATKGVASALAPAAKAMATAFGPAARVARTAIGGMLQTIRGITGVVKGVVSVATHLIRGDFAGAWRAVKGIVRSALSGLGGLVKTLMAPVYTFAASAVRSAVRAMGRLGGGIAGALKGAARGVAGAASSVAGGVLNVFRTLARLVAGVWDGIVRTIRGAFNKVKGAIDTITSLPAKGANAIFGRSGGVAHPDGFRRYQAGGVVPAMVSPGEMIVHQGRAGMVPGHPVAADNVAMMLPVGAAVLTGDGQRMVSQGASIGEAIARQAPHFKAGGHVRGKLSWFGGPHDSQDSGRTALGLTTATPGVAIRPGDTWQTGRATLGAYWRIRTPNGRSAVLRQTDLGPNESTGRRIDLTYSALGRLGYSEGNFPTDRVGVADLVGGGAARAASYRLSGYAAALARRVGASRIRSGILPDAFEQGIQQGEAGMTRARLRALGDPVYRAISAAYRVPGDRIVRVAGGRGGGSSLVSARRPIGDTWAWARALASRFGLRVSSNYRTPAHNRAVGGVPNSWHIRGSARRPEAFDFVPPSQAALGWVRSHTHPAEAMIHNAGSGLHLHVGGLYRRGGIVSRFQTGGRVPRYTYATPGERGRTIRGDEFGVYNQPSRGFGAVLGGAMFPVVRAANATFAKRFAALNAAIQNAAADKIAALRRGLTGAVRRGGSELAVKRMQQAISLIDYELGRRIGLLSRRIAARTAAADTRVARTDIGLRIRGINPDSPAAITERLGAERFRGDALHRTGRDLARQLRLAEKARNLAKITEIRQEIADNQTAILDSRANQAELGRARAEAEKAAAALRLEQRNAVYQYVADMAGSATGLAQSGLQTLELQQRLAGTYDQGGQTRADYIRSQIVPDLQAEQAAIEQQRQEAARQGNQQLAAQLAEALAAKQNEVLQSQLDAQEATAQNTAATADAIKSLGGTLGFEFGGSRLTDALLASGVGA